MHLYCVLLCRGRLSGPSYDGLPRIPAIHISLHCMDLFTGCTIGADIVASEILGLGHRFKEAYKPSRVMPGAIWRVGGSRRSIMMIHRD